jgi:hypothetical protein
MKYFISFVAGILAILLLMIVANTAFMLCTYAFWRHVPEVTTGKVVVGWDPEVQGLFARSPLYPVAMVLAFGLGSWWTYRALTRRARLIVRSTGQITRLR